MIREKKKVLLVEDDQNFGSILRDFLEINDYDVTLARNGVEGGEKLLQGCAGSGDRQIGFLGEYRHHRCRCGKGWR